MIKEITSRIFDIKRFALHDGPGTRVTVHLMGCPLSCLWCHNPEGISKNPMLLVRSNLCVCCGKCLDVCRNGAVTKKDGVIVTNMQVCTACGTCATMCTADAREICGVDIGVKEAANAVLADESFFYDESFIDGDVHSRGGVTLSGGEPLAQPDFCMALLDLLGGKGVHRVIDTCGHISEEIILKAAERCELFLFDIKHMDTVKHRELTGAGNELILSNLKKLCKAGSLVQLRIPFIPGINTDESNLNAVAELAAGLDITGVRILPYHKMAEDKHRRFGLIFRLKNAREPSSDELRYAQDVFARKGLAAVIGG